MTERKIGLDDLFAAGATVEDFLKGAVPYVPPVDARTDDAEESTEDLFTHVGSAERLVAYWGDRHAWCPQTGWYAWDQGHGLWLEDAEHVVKYAIVRDLTEVIREEMSHATSDSSIAAYKRYLHEAQHGAHIASTLKLLEGYLTRSWKEYDLDANKLTVGNGTLTFEGGEVHLQPHAPQDHITKGSPVPYVPAAPARFWEATLARFIPDDSQRAFLKRLSGAILVRGGLREQILPFFSGSGANGKSTVVHGLRVALGTSLAIEVDPSTLRSDNRAGAAPSPDKIRLMGARFVYAVEASGTLDAELLKRLTGGEEIVARQLHGKTISFKPSFTLAIVANSAPEMNDTSEGLWRRLLVVPFSVRVPDSERIDALTVEQLLSEEASGILRWMVEGYKLYMRDGLNPPDSVKLASATMRAEADFLAAFVAENIMQQEGHSLQPTSAYDAWVEWTKDEPEARSKYSGKIKLSSGLDSILGLKVSAKVDGKVIKGWKGYTLRSNSATLQPLFQDQQYSDLQSYRVAEFKPNSKSFTEETKNNLPIEPYSKNGLNSATLQPDTDYPTIGEWYDKWSIPVEERRVK